jgi:acyl-CoA thioester hydrolase
MPDKIFEHVLTVSSADIDNLNHVNNVVYLQWVQDIASAHWNSIASEEMQKKYSWVVLKHEIEYFSPAFPGDEILVKTWVEKSEGVRSERHVEFFNQKSGKRIVRARTTWCLLDSGTFRPMRIGEDILKVFH